MRVPQLLNALTGIILFCVSLATVSAREPNPTPIPVWWGTQAVISDRTPVTRVELEDLAKTALGYLDQSLPGGAGGGLHALIDGFHPSEEDQYPATIGQARVIAEPFYQRLWQVGWTQAAPWGLQPPVSNTANVSMQAAGDQEPTVDTSIGAALTYGELKRIFGFDLTGFTPTPEPSPSPTPVPDKKAAGGMMESQAMIGGGPQTNLISASNLIGWWKFSEGSGSALADSSGGGRSGTLTSDYVWRTDPTGRKSVQFTTASGLGSIPDSNLQLGASNADFSVAFWVRPEAPTINNWSVLLHKGNNDSQRTFSIWFFPNSTALLYQISTVNNASEGGQSSRELPMGLWTHVAYVKEGNTLKLYLNGVLDSSVTLSSAVVSNNGPIKIGSNGIHSPALASFDDLRLYNVALSAADVAMIQTANEMTSADADNDTRLAAQETTAGTSESLPDSDWDGIGDAQEAAAFTNPLSAASVTQKRIAYFPFDAPNFVGNEGQLPRAIRATSVPGWKGNAMYVGPGGGLLNYEWVRPDGSPNYSAITGSARMWFKTDWNSPQMSGYWSRLYDVGFFGAAQAALHFDAVEPSIHFYQADGLNHSGGVITALGTHPIFASQWRQIVATWSPTARRIYLDGQLLGEDLQTYNYPPRAVDWLIWGLKFGSDGGQPLCGAIDEAEFFNYAFTAAQIAQDYDPTPLTGVTTMTLDEDTVGTVGLSASGGGTGISSYQIVAYPTNGQAFISGSTLSYYPKTHFSGTDSFTYQITKGTNTRVVTMAVQINPVDDAPLVNVGGGKSVILPATVSLVGKILDIDTAPSGITHTWVKGSGPGDVTFTEVGATTSGSTSTITTTASFSAPGDYVLRLIASDATSVRSDSLVVSVNTAGSTIPTVSLGSISSYNSLGTPIPLQATVTVGGGATIAKVEFYEGSRKIGESTTPVSGKYQMTWTPSHLGLYNVSAVATTSTGVKGVGGTLSVRISQGNWFVGDLSGAGNEGYSGTGGDGGATAGLSTGSSGSSYAPGSGNNGGGGAAGAGGNGTGGDDSKDTDGDGLSDYVERIETHTLVDNQYSDGDALPDGQDAVPNETLMTVPAAPEANYVIVDLGNTSGETAEGLDDTGHVLLVRYNPSPDPVTGQPYYEGRLWNGGAPQTVAAGNNFIGPLADGSVYYSEPKVVVPAASGEYGSRFSAKMNRKPLVGNAEAAGYYEQGGNTHNTWTPAPELKVISAYEAQSLIFHEDAEALFKKAVEDISMIVTAGHVGGPTKNWEYYYDADASVVGMNDNGIQRVRESVSGPTSDEYYRSVVLTGWNPSGSNTIAAGTEAEYSYAHSSDPPIFHGKLISTPQINKMLFAVATSQDMGANTSEGVYFSNSSTPMTIPASTTAIDVNEAITSEGPYFAGANGSAGKIWAYHGGSLVSHDTGVISAGGGSKVSTRGISNSLVIPAGDSIWRNSRIRKIADLCGNPKDWSKFDIRYVSPEKNLLLGEATKGGVVHRVLLVPVEMITPAGDPVKNPVDAGTNTSSIPDGANEFTFSDAAAGILTIKLKAKVSGISNLGQTIQNSFKFEVDAVGNSVLAWDAANPGGTPTVNGDFLEAKVTFTGLPEHNSDFGTKKARILYDGQNVVEKTDEIFFPKIATNHPPANGLSVQPPNWFFYWQEGKVCGIPADALYDGSKNGTYGYVKPGVDSKLRLCSLAPDSNNGPETFNSQTSYGSLTVTGSGKGIQCVAETAQHELFHLSIYNDKGSKSDVDLDGVADSSEGTLGGVSSDPSDGDTYRMRDTYGTVYSSYGDNEIRCRKQELNLTIQYFPTKDWANPGCQSKNQFGPKP